MRTAMLPTKISPKVRVGKGVAAALAMLLHPLLRAQLAGPPAGVPVPPAPIAASAPVAVPPVDVPANSANFRVRVLDGRNGAPIKGAQVRLWYDEIAPPGYVLTTDAQGEALMPAPVGTPLRLLVQTPYLFDCRKLSVHEAPPGYNLQQVATKGVVLTDHCSGAPRATPHLGELTIFARPLRWYEHLNQGQTE